MSAPRVSDGETLLMIRASFNHNGVKLIIKRIIAKMGSFFFVVSSFIIMANLQLYTHIHTQTTTIYVIQRHAFDSIFILK